MLPVRESDCIQFPIVKLWASFRKIMNFKHKQSLQVHGFYNWPRIAARTEKVYEAAVTTWRDDSLMGRFCRYYQCGSWFGKICCCVAAVLHLYWKWLEAVCPRTDIEIAVSFQCPVPDTAKTLSTD